MRSWREVMKSEVKSERNAVRRAAKLRRLLALAAGSTLGLAYCLAAQQDEKNGFPLTAAMEWRKAAELFAAVSLLSDRCWHQWERLMQLPRCFASPISDCNEIALPFSPVSKQFAIPSQPPNTLSLPAAA
jgi:hypothetical protein